MKKKFTETEILDKLEKMMKSKKTFTVSDFFDSINQSKELRTREVFSELVLKYYSREKLRKYQKNTEQLNKILKGLSQQEAYDFLTYYRKKLVEVYPMIKEEK